VDDDQPTPGDRAGVGTHHAVGSLTTEPPQPPQQHSKSSWKCAVGCEVFDQHKGHVDLSLIFRRNVRGLLGCEPQL
jgi:hypothetical protein